MEAIQKTVTVEFSVSGTNPIRISEEVHLKLHDPVRGWIATNEDDGVTYEGAGEMQIEAILDWLQARLGI